MEFALFLFEPRAACGGGASGLAAGNATETWRRRQVAAVNEWAGASRRVS
jgi:hypothetical protein